MNIKYGWDYVIFSEFQDIILTILNWTFNLALMYSSKLNFYNFDFMFQCEILGLYADIINLL